MILYFASSDASFSCSEFDLEVVYAEKSVVV